MSSSSPPPQKAGVVPHESTLKRHIQPSSCSEAPPRKIVQYTCSTPTHADVLASSYCSICARFLCKECEEHHMCMCPDHANVTYADLSSLKSIFTGKCPTHPDDILDYLCCTHKTLCCARCRLSKDGAHTKCDVMLIEESMCDELPSVMAALEKKIRVVKTVKLNVLKMKQDVLNAHIADAKLAVTNTFKEIRSILNARENELMDELNNTSNDCNKNDMIMAIENSHVPDDVLEDLRNASKMDKKSHSDPGRIRNVINCICKAKESIVDLSKTEEEVDSVLCVEDAIEFSTDKSMVEQLKGFGNVLRDNLCNCKWKPCPANIDEKRKYSVCEDVAKKSFGSDNYCTIITNETLLPDKIVSWNINIVKTLSGGGNILIGVAPFDIDQNNDNSSKCGWYLHCYDLKLWSGPPHNYEGKEYAPKKGKKNVKCVHTGDTVGIVMNMVSGTLIFKLDGISHEVAFEGIPLDKPLVPCVLLMIKDDSVKIGKFKIEENVSKEIAVPTNITGKSTTYDSITLSWDPVIGASFYQIEVDKRKRYGVSQANTYKWVNLPVDTNHAFRVRTVKGKSMSEWSDVLRARTQVYSFKYCWWKEPSGENNYSLGVYNPRFVSKKFNSDGRCIITGSVCLSSGTINSWSIKIRKSACDDGNGIYIGVAPSDITQSEYANILVGWYIHCYNFMLFSGPPHNYSKKRYGPMKENGKYVHTGDVVSIMMDLLSGELSFILNGINLGVAYEGIPLDKPLAPAISLGLKDDSIELDSVEVGEKLSNNISIPSNIVITSNTWTSLSLSWTPVINASFYQIEVNERKSWITRADNSLNIKKSSPNAEYKFRIRAVCGRNVGRWCNVLKVVSKKVPFPECTWKKCPEGIDEEMKYTINLRNNRVASSNADGWCTIIGNAFLYCDKINTWYIKLLKSKNNDLDNIYVGIAPFDICQNNAGNYSKCGWYLSCRGLELWSGPPHNYKNKSYGLKMEDEQYLCTGDSVGVVMDASKRELSFTVDSISLGIAYEGIPLDKPLIPCVILYHKNDKIELDFSPKPPKVNHIKIQWKECPEYVCDDRKYCINDDKLTIATKTGSNGFYSTVIGTKSIPMRKISSWNIKILETLNNNGSGISIGVAPLDIDQNGDDNYCKCGWYFQWYTSKLFSGPPHNYKGKDYGIMKDIDERNIIIGSRIGVVMNMILGELSFIVNGVNLGVAYEGIPLDKPLVPCVLLWNDRDSVEIKNTPHGTEIMQNYLGGNDCILQ